MTEQARQDLTTIVKATELPTAIVERRTEWEKRTRLLGEDVEPHRNDNGTYNLKLVTQVAGKNVSELEKHDKLQAIWKETREIQDLFEEMSDLANVHEERRRLARQQLNGIERRDIRFDDEAPRHVEALTKSVIEVHKTQRNAPADDFKDLELRALLSTSDSWTPEVTRTGKVQMIGYQVPNLLQLFRQGSTTQSAVKYEEEIVEVSNMRTIAEAAKYPEGKVRIVTRRAEIEKIGTTLRVTDEELDDEVRMRGYMQMKLPNWLNRRIDSYVLYGLAPVSGSSDSDDDYPEFGGLSRMGVRTGASTTGAEGETDAGSHQTDKDAASVAGTEQGAAAVLMAKTGAISVPNLIRKGFAQIMVNYGMPGPVIMHPFTWNEIATLQTADGHYIWSHPSQNPTPMIWGQRIVENTNVMQDDAWTGDFANHAEWVNRKGVMIEWGMAGDDFLRDIRRVKICIRAGIIFYRPKVFVRYTGLS